MTEILQDEIVLQAKLQAATKEFITDKIVDSWLLMDNIYLVPALVVVYLAFAFKLGPKFMEKREPMNIKGLVICHNFVQILINGWLVSLLFSTPNAISYLAKNNCSPVEKNNPLYYALCGGGWYFFMSKVYDLLDTVFFVLSKKQSHVNYLHVYHHVIMLLTTWIYAKYIRVDQGVFIGVLNSSVHVTMYTYYFLSALGPSVQKYLWWKKYVTIFQLVQFGIVCIYDLFLIQSNCIQSQVLVFYSLLQAIIFGILFSDFYRRAYLKKKI